MYVVMANINYSLSLQIELFIVYHAKWDMEFVGANGTFSISYEMELVICLRKKVVHQSKWNLLFIITNGTYSLSWQMGSKVYHVKWDLKCIMTNGT